MDKLVSKFQVAQGDDFLLHRIFNSLEEIIESNLKANFHEHGCFQTNIVELKLLYDKCGDLDYSTALQACLTVTSLNKKGLLSDEECLIALTTTTTTAKYLGVLVDAIASLLPCRSDKINRHPYITLLEKRSETWPYIAQQLNSLIKCKSSKEKDDEIRVLAIYILCCGEQEAKMSFWSMLMNELHISKKEVIINVLLESLIWNQESDPKQCSSYVTRVQQLCDYAIANNSADLAFIVSIFLASSLHLSHQCWGFGMQQSISRLITLVNKFSFQLEPIVILISQLFLVCYPNCYEPLLDLCLQLCHQLFNRNCNVYVWSMLQSAVLFIFTYSTRNEPAVIRIMESAPSTVCPYTKRPYRMPTQTQNPYFHLLARADIRIKTAMATVECARWLQESESHDQVLSNLLHSPPPNSFMLMPDSIFLLCCSIFWHDSNPIVLERIVQHVATSRLLAPTLMTLLLKKLTMPKPLTDPQTKVAVLHSLPKLASEKSSIPRVLQILDALSSAKDIQPLRLRLLTNLWTIQDRTYPHLEKMIMADQPSPEYQLAKAAAIEVICSAKAEKYGADLLSQISELLNSSLGHQENVHSSTLATMALNSLTTLCRAEVVDLKSVWDILAPKLTRDHRPAVVTGMCHLLALAPQLRIDTEEYQLFIQQAITILFQISLKSDQSPEVVSVALRALSGFRHEDFILKSMPHNCKADLKIPSKYLPAKTEESAPPSAEDVLDHVPGVCWTKLMDMYSNDVMETGFRHLMSRLVAEEVANMPAWVYRKAAMDVTRMNEPPNYNSSLKDDSVLAALVQYMLRICEVSPDIRLRIKLILSVLAGPFEKPLPPLDWSVLEATVEQYELRAEFAAVVLPQAPHSYSAQSIADKTLSMDSLDSATASVVFRHLAAVSKVIKPKSVDEFVGRFFSQTREPEELTQVLEQLHKALEKDEQESTIPAEIRKLVASHVVPLVALLPEDVTSGKFVECFARCYRLLNDGSVPVYVPDTLARKYIVVFCLAAGECSTAPKVSLSYLHKALQMVEHLCVVDQKLRQLFSHSVEALCPVSKSTEFLQQFMSYIQLATMKAERNEVPMSSSNILINLMDVFCLLVSTLSNSKAFVQPRCMNGTYLTTFPLAIHRLVNQPGWANTKKSMLNWILAMMDATRVGRAAGATYLEGLWSILFKALSALEPASDKEAFTRIISLKK